MTDTTLRSAPALPGIAAPAKLVNGWNALRPTGLLARLEQAFIAWQAARLETLTPERLWAPAMQDARSFAEIRRARRQQRQG